MCSLAVQTIVNRVSAGELVDEIDISSGTCTYTHIISDVQVVDYVINTIQSELYKRRVYARVQTPSMLAHNAA